MAVSLTSGSMSSAVPASHRGHGFALGHTQLSMPHNATFNRRRAQTAGDDDMTYEPATGLV